MAKKKKTTKRKKADQKMFDQLDEIGRAHV